MIRDVWSIVAPFRILYPEVPIVWRLWPLTSFLTSALLSTYFWYLPIMFYSYFRVMGLIGILLLKVLFRMSPCLWASKTWVFFSIIFLRLSSSRFLLCSSLFMTRLLFCSNFCIKISFCLCLYYLFWMSWFRLNLYSSTVIKICTIYVEVAWSLLIAVQNEWHWETFA